MSLMLARKIRAEICVYGINECLNQTEMKVHEIIQGVSCIEKKIRLRANPWEDESLPDPQAGKKQLEREEESQKSMLVRSQMM